MPDPTRTPQNTTSDVRNPYPTRRQHHTGPDVRTPYFAPAAASHSEVCSFINRDQAKAAVSSQSGQHEVPQNLHRAHLDVRAWTSLKMRTGMTRMSAFRSAQISV
eukprot:2560839-Rhodomonas_salina.2